jgi:hypothetical protein
VNPFKILIIFQLDFASKFYNSKFREISKLGQNGKLFVLNLSTTMSSFISVGHQEGYIL